MIPGTLNPEIHVTKIEIQNEIKSTEIKKSVNNCLTSVNIHETLKQENAEDHENNAEIINVINENIAVSNMQEHGINAAITNIYRMEKSDSNVRKVSHDDPESKNPAIYPKHYWVQLNIVPSNESSSASTYDSSRNGFVALICAITLVMYIITTGFVASVYFTKDLRDFFKSNGSGVFLLGMAGLLTLGFVVLCIRCSRKLPCNIVVLLLVVCCISVMAASRTGQYETDIFLIALVVTAITVLVSLCLALTNFDFTSCWFFIIGMSVAIIALVLAVTIVSVNRNVMGKPIYLGILAGLTLLNVIVFLAQLQEILGNKPMELSEDDWALGAFMLFSIIVEIVFTILKMMGISPRGD